MKKKLCTAIVILLAAVSAGGCRKKEEIQKYSHVDYAMGTVTNTTLYGNSPNLDKTEQKMIEEMKQLETKQLSWRKESSGVAELNRGSQKEVSLSDPLYTWLKKCLQIAKDSSGAADPAIGSLTRMWDFESDNPSAPDAEKITALLDEGIINNAYQHVKLDDKKKTVKKNTSVKIDLGAFGKGIGTDQALKFLRKDKKVTGGMVALGGSIVVYGEKPDGEDWTVGIQNPKGQQGETIGGVTVQSGTFISTSGDYEKYFVDKKTGKRYFHILDEKTGYPAETDITSCTIVCDSGLVSDGLSTACFVLGPEKSRPLLKKYGAKAIFVDKKKNIYVSSGLEFRLTDDSYTVAE
ncbi:FAD:protein FMN transferase [Anaerostipes sp.]|uniref:FAD:protein FMN transferase n=1 Tax=Anaerostipes sp. TaxID=1872530 RepID=UPI0025BE8859|nr:FAD:protein FMN transferase [Anaerostipes sp.]MBS7007643.1 FAD:protein FMN transferase [Anaerostipes sp.]